MKLLYKILLSLVLITLSACTANYIIPENTPRAYLGVMYGSGPLQQTKIFIFEDAQNCKGLKTLQTSAIDILNGTPQPIESGKLVSILIDDKLAMAKSQYVISFYPQNGKTYYVKRNYSAFEIVEQINDITTPVESKMRKTKGFVEVDSCVD